MKLKFFLILVAAVALVASIHTIVVIRVLDQTKEPEASHHIHTATTNMMTEMKPLTAAPISRKRDEGVP